MRISDWSSDVCSSDLALVGLDLGRDDIVRHGQNLRRDAPCRCEIRDDRGQRIAPLPSLAPQHMQREIAITELKPVLAAQRSHRSEEHTSELQSLIRNSYAVFCLKKKKMITQTSA